MRIAIVGSRGYQHLDRVKLFVLNLDKGTVVITGGAEGVDQKAEEVAKYLGMEVKIYKPRYDLYPTNPRYAPIARNEWIVEDCDELVAFWDGKSRGTLSSINIAKRLGKKAHIIGDA